MSFRTATVAIDLDEIDDVDLIDELNYRIEKNRLRDVKDELQKLRMLLITKVRIGTTMDEERFMQMVSELAQKHTWQELIDKLEK